MEQVKATPQECVTVKEKYLYIIKNNSIYSQDKFRELYLEIFDQNPTQSTIAQNFKKYSIKKSPLTGLYDTEATDEQDVINTILEIVEKRCTDKEKKEIKQKIIDWKTSDINTVTETNQHNNDKYYNFYNEIDKIFSSPDLNNNEQFKRIRAVYMAFKLKDETIELTEKDKTSMNLEQLLQTEVLSIVFSEDNNTLTITLRQKDNIIKERLCECIYQYHKSDWKYATIIKGYNSIILYSPKTKELLEFCRSIKIYYSDPIIEIQ